MLGTKRLNDRDFALMEHLMLSKQPQIKKMLAQVLTKYYSAENLIIAEDYLAAVGDIPIAVAAHMDTVWETSTGHEVFYDRKKNVMVNLRGGGYDDKVGIFMILKLLDFGYRPHVIFCANEEIGSLGADAFIKAYPTCPFPDCRFIIMLDRRGIKDCVFYDCDNEDFEKYCEGFGFETAYGSFTDICTLCPAWGMAGVNFSVGYMDEHTANEKLYVGAMFETLKKVEDILGQDKDSIPSFKYIPLYQSYYGYGYYKPVPIKGEILDWANSEYNHNCWGCGIDMNLVQERDRVSFVDGDGYVQNYCPECAKRYIKYCEICGQPYEADYDHSKYGICPECYYDLLSEKYGE